MCKENGNEEVSKYGIIKPGSKFGWIHTIKDLRKPSIKKWSIEHCGNGPLHTESVDFLLSNGRLEKFIAGVLNRCKTKGINEYGECKFIT